MTTALKVNELVCKYDSERGAAPVIDHLSLELPAEEIGCLLGSSGCGKTTALRAIAGFQAVESGSIELFGNTLSSANTHVPAQKRQVGMVFQDYALFPHLSVCDNITFGVNHLPAKQKRALCHELLELVKLNHLGHRFAHELSGGQQQRVALARALAPAPKLLLLDEPFSSLDTDLRRTLALEVREILKAKKTSAIMVTHDQEEAFAFADKVGVLHQGKLQQWDVPFSLYHEPQSRYVASFIGQGVFIPGTIQSTHTIETELGVLSSSHRLAQPLNSRVEVLLRPDDVVLDTDNTYSAEVTHKIFTGTSTQYTLKLSTGSTIEAALPSHHNFDCGQTISVKADADHLIAFELA